MKDILTSEGTTGVLNYRLRSMAKDPRPFDEQVCAEAFRQLTTVICVDANESTNGGTLQIGGDWELGVDPDSSFNAEDDRYTTIGTNK
jgi:hypothetical protein